MKVKSSSEEGDFEDEEIEEAAVGTESDHPVLSLAQEDKENSKTIKTLTNHLGHIESKVSEISKKYEELKTIAKEKDEQIKKLQQV